MDELRGPSIQIVLHVKEGLGFGFLRSPFVVSGSLNGYMLETDPVVPCHAPVFDAELVWEADKRKFRSLRVQNVPVKVEVYTTGTQGRKDKVGYLLLSLLGAQPNPANKVVDVRTGWHRLLGVKAEGKCCHPQLALSLTVEDRDGAVTPRNELRMFHSNEVASPSTFRTNEAPPVKTSMLLTYSEYISESKRSVPSLELQPRLICEEGLIQVGAGRELFVLSFVIGSLENLDLLLPDSKSYKEGLDCYVAYSIFTHNVMTDRVGISESAAGVRAQFHQRTALRVRSSLAALAQYFSHCPALVARVCAGEDDVGVCSLDLRKLIPTTSLQTFLRDFCNRQRALCIEERCHVVRRDPARQDGRQHGCQDGRQHGCQDGRRAYVDVEMTLTYQAEKPQKPPPVLTARSASQLRSGGRGAAGAGPGEGAGADLAVECRSGSCSQLAEVAAYTNMAASNTARYKNASGDSVLKTNEIAEMIKNLCESFTESQQKLLAAARPATSDVMVQCEGEELTGGGGALGPEDCLTARNVWEKEPVKIESSKSDTCIHHQKLQQEKAVPNEPKVADPLQLCIPVLERDAIMKKYVEELEDWKEKQQELFKCQLKRKEEYHLDLLAKEWTKKRVELESKLKKGIDQCRTLAADLSRATDDFRLRGYRNTEREKKLSEAKKALEAHYTAKYQELREASQKMEDDMRHQLALKDMVVEELELKVAQLEKQLDVLKNNMKNVEKENENRYSGLTKDQTASLIQELRCLEEKLDSAVQSKTFFKEQWGRAVRELHVAKLSTRRQMLAQLDNDRKLLGDLGLDTIPDKGEKPTAPHVDIKKLKDDFYVDLLANTPALDSRSIINTSCPDGMDMYEELKCAPKNPASDKLNELISQRDALTHADSPDEARIQQLNVEIRNLLLNCNA